MPKPRSPENRGLPERWQYAHGAYYYRVPVGLEAFWDGKRRFRLGANLADAHDAYSKRVGTSARGSIRTAGELLDRYVADVVPGKPAPKTRADNLRAIERLRSVFRDIPLLTPNWPQLFYGYAERRKKPDGSRALTAAHRELEVMSHAFTKAVQWGLLSRHPTYEQVRFDGDLAVAPRTRYVEDWEIVECLSLTPYRKAGSVLMVQAYIRLKLLTGLARSDLLRLRLDDHIREDGIHVQRHKTRGSSGQRAIYDYDKVPERRDAVDQCKRVRPALSPFLFCKANGEGYFDESKGTAHAWDCLWWNFMDRLLKESKVKERFTEHDLRAKVGSDAESLERCRALLMHADPRSSKRFYRRKPERV